METWAERVAAAAGVKFTAMVQLALALRLDPQVLVWAKSRLLVPVMVMLVMVSVAVPGLVRVTACGALVVPSAWLPRAREAGMKLTAGCGAGGGVPPPQPPRGGQRAEGKRKGGNGPANGLFLLLH